MVVRVLDHQHEPALMIQGDQQQMLLQTGTLVIDFRGSVIGDWTRERLTHPVLDLPDTVALTDRVAAIASAAPASMLYFPQPGPPVGVGGLFAQGNVVSHGSFDGTFVQVLGSAYLPVFGATPAQAVPLAGWAVDATSAVLSSKHQILLVADLAVTGAANLLRLAYSLFVTISANTELKTAAQ